MMRQLKTLKDIKGRKIIDAFQDDEYEIFLIFDDNSYIKVQCYGYDGELTTYRDDVNHNKYNMDFINKRMNNE